MFTTSIVVIEDQTEMLEIYTEALSIIKDIIITSFNNPIKAINYSIENKPDIIITDNMMPYADGLYVAEKIKEVYAPKIILTSAVTRHAFKYEQISNFDKYIQKPFDIFDLLKLVEELIKDVNNDKKNLLDKIASGLLGDINIIGKDRIFIESVIKNLMYDTDKPADNSIYSILSEKMEKDESTIRRNISKTINNAYEPSIFEKIGFKRRPKNKEFINKLLERINEKAKNERWD